MNNANIHGLLGEYARSRDIAVRNVIIEEYLPLVRRCAGSMYAAYRRHITLDEMCSSGILGLIGAIDRYDPAKGNAFEAYASRCIRGAILDELRRGDHVSAYMRTRIKNVTAAVATFTAKNGVTPSNEEIAAITGYDAAQVQSIMDDAYAQSILSIDALTESGEYISASPTDEPSFVYEENAVIEMLAQCIDKLTERQRIVLSLYYKEELTLREIGQVLSLSESRISQIHAKTLLELRALMQRE